MTVDTLPAEAPSTDYDTPEVLAPSAKSTPTEVKTEPDVAAAAASAEEKPKKAPAKKAPGKKSKTLELTLTVTGTADGEWHAELKRGTTYLARGLAVAAAAVSRAATAGPKGRCSRSRVGSRPQDPRRLGLRFPDHPLFAGSRSGCLRAEPLRCAGQVLCGRT